VRQAYLFSPITPILTTDYLSYAMCYYIAIYDACEWDRKQAKTTIRAMA